MAKGLCELIWLKQLFTEIGFAPSCEMDVFCDSKAAIDISHNPVQHDRNKHVEVDRHFIKQNLESKIIRFPFIKSEEQLADVSPRQCAVKTSTTHLISWASEICMHQREGECGRELLLEIIWEYLHVRNDPTI
jgi:hypothetical protein